MAKNQENINRDKLADILMSYAENVSVNRNEAIAVVNSMNGKATFKDYLYAISDGIKYGNWPWNIIKPSNLQLKDGE